MDLCLVRGLHDIDAGRRIGVGVRAGDRHGRLRCGVGNVLQFDGTPAGGHTVGRCEYLAVGDALHVLERPVGRVCPFGDGHRLHAGAEVLRAVGGGPGVGVRRLKVARVGLPGGADEVTGRCEREVRDRGRPGHVRVPLDLLDQCDGALLGQLTVEAASCDLSLCRDELGLRRCRGVGRNRADAFFVGAGEAAGHQREGVGDAIHLDVDLASGRAGEGENVVGAVDLLIVYLAVALVRCLVQLVREREHLALELDVQIAHELRWVLLHIDGVVVVPHRAKQERVVGVGRLLGRRRDPNRALSAWDRLDESWRTLAVERP